MKETNKEYAEALFKIAAENKSIEEYSNALKEILALLQENKEYVEFLASPALSLSERLLAIDEAFSKMPENIVSFLKLLTENGHIKEIYECINEFFGLEMLLKNSVTVKVYSSVALTDEQKEKLVEKLESKYGKTVDSEYITDKSLISGIKIVMEDKVLDGSIEKRLQSLKEVIK